MHKFLRQKSPSDLLIQKTDSAINDSLMSFYNRASPLKETSLMDFFCL